MKRQAFLEALKLALKDLPEQEIQSSLAYFNEMIDDRMDDGMTEEEAVTDMGNVDEIATKLLVENQTLVKRVKDKFIPKRRLATWETQTSSSYLGNDSHHSWISNLGEFTPSGGDCHPLSYHHCYFYWIGGYCGYFNWSCPTLCSTF